MLQSNFILGNVGQTPDNQPAFFGSSREKPIFKGSNPLDVRVFPTHFYATYSNEFLQVDFGRQPFSFGLHMTYSDGFHPLMPAYDVRDAVAIKIQYESLYIKPYVIVYNQNEVSGYGGSLALAGGYKADGVTAEFLYKSKNYMVHKNENPAFVSKPLIDAQTLNVYGKYTEGPVTASAEWGFLENPENSAGFAQVSWDTSFYNTSLGLIGGYISSYDISLNYDPTFMFWAEFYALSGIDGKGAMGPTNCFVLSPFAIVDLTDKHSVTVLHVWMSDKNSLNLKTMSFLLLQSIKLQRAFLGIISLALSSKGLE